MDRRLAALLTTMAMLACAPEATRAQSPQSNRYSQRQAADLTELLTAGLKVRTAAEKAFIAKVVETVDEGQLSDAVVKAVFQRARKEHSRYPLPYFAVMIRKVAKDRGVEL